MCELDLVVTQITMQIQTLLNGIFLLWDRAIVRNLPITREVVNKFL